MAQKIIGREQEIKEIEALYQANKQFGAMALASVGFFMLVLVFGLAYAWRKGALEWK